MAFEPLLSGLIALALSAPIADMAQSQQPTPTASAPITSQTAPTKRTHRRRSSTTSQKPATPPVGPSAAAAQRARDQKILELQKEQSAAIARDQDAVNKKLLQDQQQVQSEPRIQDAPGPGAQPLPGNPAIQPTAPSEPPRIQDAPGPAQTLPKPPPTPQP